MGQALYRKHRPKGLSEVIGQEHITRALSRALEQGKISHAYLFTGPRGVGKTSIARILAHAVNDLPYTDESSHLDIIEIDAASNRRIDEIRDLRDKVHIAPTSAKYKVYIVDEVHMLTREAFNALLKTLEEPPEHVIFILATTEMHKLPETIVSRTQHYTFKPYEYDLVAQHLQSIAKAEKFSIDKDALTLIAQHGGGSFRDSISLLDQVRNYTDKVTAADVRALLGIAPDALVGHLIDALQDRDTPGLMKLLDETKTQGIEPAMVAKQLGQTLRAQLLDGNSLLGHDETLQLLGKLVEVPASSDPFAALELCLLGVTLAGSSTAQVQPLAFAQDTVQETPPAAAPAKPTAKQPEKKEAAPKAAEQPKPQGAAEAKPEAATEPSPAGITDTTWSDVLTVIKQKYNTMYGVLRMAEPKFDGSTLTLTFEFAFHQKRANDAKNKKIIIDAIKDISGEKIDLVCVVGKPSGKPKAANPEPVKAAADASLGAISNIFGGGELLES